MSRGWATLAASVGLVALLAILAAWQVPAWLDWGRYRGTIEALAAKTLHQPVAIEGPISLRLLPRPVLTAARVTLGGSAGASMRVDALRLSVALLPLVGGRVEAGEAVLRGADLRIPWPASPGIVRFRSPPWLAPFAARIEDGRLTIGRLLFTGVDATLATLETGALAASGTVRFGAEPRRFTARLTAAGADNSAGLDVAVSDSNLAAQLTAQIAADGTLSGRIAASGRDLAALLPAPAVPFQADGRLTVGGGLLAVDDMALTIADSPASGAVALRLVPQARLDIALAASRLDLDAWLPGLIGSGGRIAGIELPIGIDLSVESAPLRAVALEHLRATFELSDGSVAVREASARLPGNGTLRLAGLVVRDPMHLGFEGEVALHAPVLADTLRWLQGIAPGVLSSEQLPQGVLRSADLTAQVSVGNGAVALRHLAGRVDDVPIAGEIGYRQADPPVVTAALELDRLALDPWLPAIARLKDVASRVKGTLSLQVRQADVGGFALEGLALDGSVAGSGVALRRLEATVGRAHVLVSGRVTGDGVLHGASLTVKTAEAAPLAAMLPEAWRPVPALWRGPGSLEVHADGPPHALAVAAHLSLSGAELQADPVVDLASREWRGTLSLHHGPLSLTATLAGGPGRLFAPAFDLAASGMHATGSLALDATGPLPMVTGRVRADTVALPLPEGAANAPLPIGLLRGWHGTVEVGARQLTSAVGAVLRDASARVAVEDGVLRIDGFTAKLGSGALSGGFGFDARPVPPSLSANLALHDASITGPLTGGAIDLLSGRANADLVLTASGYSPAALLATVAGRVALLVTNGELAGFDLSALQRAVDKPDPKSAGTAVAAALRGGTTGFDRLDLAGKISDGQLAFAQALLQSAAGEAQCNGRISLPARTLDVTIALHPAVAQPPPIALRLGGPIDHPDRRPELAEFARWMTELVH